MKRILINAYQVGLVLKRGVYKRMLTEGKYWLLPSETVYVYDITKPFVAPVELNILLQDAQLAEALIVVEVKDNEIVLRFENGLLTEVLTAGRYTFWKSVVKYDFIRADFSKIEIPESIDRSMLTSRQLSPYVHAITVADHDKAMLVVDGKYQRLLEAGVYYWFRNSIAIQVFKVDNRQQQIEINGQEILTRDKAALRINAWAQYKVTDIEKAILYNKEYEKQLYVNFQVALRAHIGTFSLDELLEKKENMAPVILQNVRESAHALGVEVNGFGIRDIILPGDVKEIMNQVLIAEKKAQANIIMRREETASTRSLLNTAKLMEDNVMLFKLKEMEYVEKIADKISNISVSGNGVLIEQLKQIFVPQK